MATSLLKRIKAKEGEDLSDSNVKRVLDLLNGENPITKKVACELLNISYNTTRLQTILENYKQKKQKETEFRARNRGKPPTEYEIQSIIEKSLEGTPLGNIAASLYRPVYFVKNIIEECGVPVRNVGANFFHDVPLIPEECVKEEFSIGEKVFSARYQSLAFVDRVLIDKHNNKVYSIYLLDEDMKHYAYQPWWELASLQHLKKYGVKV